VLCWLCCVWCAWWFSLNSRRTEECIASSSQPSNSLQILSRLPEDHKHSVKHLLQFLREVGKPENQQKTKMGYSNLALVFAPTFFRPPLTDCQAMLAKSDLERAFIQGLLEFNGPLTF
jgi:hypothetical protein